MTHPFHTSSDDEISAGKTTDIYFVRTQEILAETGLGKRDVVMELTTGSLPKNWTWAVLTGTTELVRLLEGKNLDLYLMPEGTIFQPKDDFGIRVPIGVMEGSYGEFCIFETPALGLICQSTGASTAAARIRMNAGDYPIIAFGARRMHPAITPMLDWAAYVGGFDGVSTVAGSELLGVQPTGTMPHALILVAEDQIEAWKAFDSVMHPEVPRIMLVDTLFDEKVETIMAVEALQDNIEGVRLDTPSSRRGDMADIVAEVRWELDLRGYEDVKIFVSGGLTEESVRELVEVGAKGFGVGTSVSAAPVVDFAADIVEVEGRPLAKRGKFGGRKQVWRCEDCFSLKVTRVQEREETCSNCGGTRRPMLQRVLKGGVLERDLPTADQVRDYVLEQLAEMPLAEVA
jgi:nicotinate phosphoribosyltransferase